MTPIVSYKHFIKNATDKSLARYQIRRKILSQQMTISEAARSLSTSRPTIRKLLNDDDLNYETKKRPISSPLKISDALEHTIIEYHNQTGYGAALLSLNFPDISCCVTTIQRVLNENGLSHKRERKYKRQKRIRSIRNTLKAFEYWQFDTKYLTDIPNLAEGIYNEYVPMYEYTLRDLVTGTTFLGYGMKERNVEGSCSFVGLALYHMQRHGIDTHYVTIQSDNGPEIIGNFYKKDRYEIQKVVEEEYQARFKTTPARRPTWNSHVESFHGRVEPELYDRMKVSDTQQFIDEVKIFIDNWNTRRKSLRYKKSPEMIAREYGYNLDKSFYNLPTLIYDKLSQTFINSPGNYLPLKVNILEI